MTYDDFQEVCGGEPFEVLSDLDNAISELLDTGSVTVQIRGKFYVLQLTVTEV